MSKQKIFSVLILFTLSTGWMSCSHDKFPLPSIPDVDDRYANIGKAVYNLVYPILNDKNGYNFRRPADIYFGVDNFLYVCDTDNNRIVMLDGGGAVQGYSQFILHPEAVTQNDSLALLIVNKTNKIYRLDLFSVGHVIGSAPVEEVFAQTSEPSRQFTGISVHNGFEYYVTVVDTADSNSNYLEFSFIYDFNRKHQLKGPLPLYVNGTGLFSAIVPTAIVSIRERYLDINRTLEDSPAFWFTQTGRTSLLANSFKIQEVTTRKFEGQDLIIPNTGLIGTDVYSTDRYWNPEDIALDRQGYCFVVDAGRTLADPDTTKPLPGFYRFTPSGTLLQSVTGLGNGDKQFTNPKGIAVSPYPEDQTVYIADTDNNRILLFRLSTN